MVYLYQRVKGRELEDFIARIDEVQLDLEERTFQMAIQAEADLRAHTNSGASYVDIAHGDIDWYVCLDDTRGQDAALSIEFGRAGYIDPSTGATWGAMDGLFILANATRIAKQKSKRLPKVRRKRVWYPRGH